MVSGMGTGTGTSIGTRTGTRTEVNIGIGAAAPPGEGSDAPEGGSAGGVADTWAQGRGRSEAAGPRERPRGPWVPLGGPGTLWGLPGHGQPGAGSDGSLHGGEQETSGSFVGAAQWEIVRRDPAPPGSAEPLSARPGP